MPQILRFDQLHTSPEASAPLPERVVEGAPEFITRNHYTDSTERFFSGEWSATVGAWRVVYEPHEEEFCVLLEGHAQLLSDSGELVELRAGDSFVIPGGYSGVWRNLSPVRKHYAIALLAPVHP